MLYHDHRCPLQPSDGETSNKSNIYSHWQGQVVFDESSYTDSDTDDLSGAYEHL